MTKILINQIQGRIFDEQKCSYIIMDTENRKINYINDIEFIEEESGIKHYYFY